MLEEQKQGKVSHKYRQKEQNYNVVYRQIQLVSCRKGIGVKYAGKVINLKILSSGNSQAKTIHTALKRNNPAVISMAKLA